MDNDSGNGAAVGSAKHFRPVRLTLSWFTVETGSTVWQLEWRESDAAVAAAAAAAATVAVDVAAAG